MRSPLFEGSYSPQFSGHETFPLRYGWLKKVYDRVSETEDSSLDNRTACWGDDAIARFGVGKNMVAAMRHWAKVVRIIKEPSVNKVQTTDLGNILFSQNGLDHYMENPSTLWLIHWQLASQLEKTTWFWAFSHYPAMVFDRDGFEKQLERFIQERGWPAVALKTLKNDVACFLRTYVARQPSGRAGHDDTLESPLTELGIIKAVSKKDSFRFVRGPKPTLGNGIFIYALIDFWSRYAPNTTTLSFEAVAHAPGGPGRVFMFDEDDTVNRLSMLEDVTGGELRWSETAGLKQVVREVDFDEDSPLAWLGADYDSISENRKESMRCH